MTDIVLHDIDQTLADRIRRMSQAFALPLPDTLLQLLEHGLRACEGEVAARLDDKEAHILKSAISALEQVADDPGFAMIGRPMPARPATPEEPDQRITASFELK